jgi:hypothetical protein
MKLVSLTASLKPKYKWLVVLQDGQTQHSIHFGARGYDDFTTHKDEKRKANYIKRHQPREDWTNPLTAGFWSRWLLWNLPTIKASLADVKKRL